MNFHKKHIKSSKNNLFRSCEVTFLFSRGQAVTHIFLSYPLASQ